MEIKRIACPSCGSSQLRHDEQGNLVCGACGSLFRATREQVSCRICGALNPAEARRCMNCGSVLGRQCSACGHVNEPGVDVCEQCGTRLDTLSSIMSRMKQRSEDAVVDRMEQMSTTKHTDLSYMQVQRDQLMAEEHVRLTTLTEQQARHRREQRRVMVMLLLMGSVLVMIAGALIFWAVTAAP